MKKGARNLALFGTLTVFSVLGMSGCGQKTIKVETAEETAVVADTTGGSNPVTVKKEEKTELPSTTTKVETTLPTTEAAGPVELLDTPLGQTASSSMSGDESGKAVVAGSRTNLGLLPIYFDFDKSIVRQDQVDRLAANANFLKTNPAIKVRIEGNCDERGTNEYNLALGERRAMGTKKYLVNLGVADARLGVLSYGEERPVNLGHDEAAWAANRRGDFVIVH